MIKKSNKKLKVSLKINILALFLLITGALALPQVSQASIFDQVINGFKATGDSAGYNPTESGAPVREFVPAWSAYLSGFLTLLGFLFLTRMIYGGWMWMSARGNEESVKKGQKILTEATIAFAIMIGARIITEFVVQALSSTVNL